MGTIQPNGIPYIKHTDKISFEIPLDNGAVVGVDIDESLEDTINYLLGKARRTILQIVKDYANSRGYAWFFHDFLLMVISYENMKNDYDQSILNRFLRFGSYQELFHDAYCLSLIDQYRKSGNFNISGSQDFDIDDIKCEVKTIQEYPLSLPTSDPNNFSENYNKMLNIVKSRVEQGRRQVDNKGTIFIAFLDNTTNMFLHFFLVALKFNLTEDLPKLSEQGIVLVVTEINEARTKYCSLTEIEYNIFLEHIRLVSAVEVLSSFPKKEDTEEYANFSVVLTPPNMEIFTNSTDYINLAAIKIMDSEIETRLKISATEAYAYSKDFSLIFRLSKNN